MSIDKREAFVRLAERRTNAVLEKIRILSNLSNPYAYDYSDDDVRSMFAAIDSELKKAKARFQSRTQKTEFRLRASEPADDPIRLNRRGAREAS